MKSRKSDNDNRSVLNTDAFDKRRFKEIFDMSPGLQKVRSESVLPMYDSLLGDIWASLYKMKPEIIAGDVDPVLQVNQSLMERIMVDKTFINYRSFTRLDDLLSAIGTVKFGEKTNQWLAEQIEEDEDFQNQMQDMDSLQRQLLREDWLEETGSRVSEENLIEVMSQLDEKLREMLQKNSGGFSEALAEAVQETTQVKEGLKALLGGYNAGRGDAELKKVPLRDQLVLAEKLATENTMKEIAEWAGRFKQIARKRQKSTYSEAMERNGVTMGNVIERLLPMELGLYMHPTTKKDFLRRFVEGQTMMYEQKGQEVLGKGPIILCLDQSGSMRYLDHQSKGFTLALMSIAKRQRRDFCLILFSTRIQVFKYQKGKIKSADMVKLARTFLSGGTDFTLPLGQSLKIINESSFKQADVVFVTDGENRVRNSFLEEFNKKKKEKEFHVLAFILGGSPNTVEPFSDKIVSIKDFEDEGSHVAFEI